MSARFVRIMFNDKIDVDTVRCDSVSQAHRYVNYLMSGNFVNVEMAFVSGVLPADLPNFFDYVDVAESSPKFYERECDRFGRHVAHAYNYAEKFMNYSERNDRWLIGKIALIKSLRQTFPGDNVTLDDLRPIHAEVQAWLDDKYSDYVATHKKEFKTWLASN